MQLKFDQVVEYIAATDNKEEIAKAMKSYCAVRVAQNIEKAWENAHRWYGKLMRLRSDRLRKTKLSMNDYTGVIEVPIFIDFFAMVENELIKSMINAKTEEGRHIAENIHDTMWNAIESNVKIDRRRILQLHKEEE